MKLEWQVSAAEDERLPPFILLHKGEVGTHTQLRKQYHKNSIEHYCVFCKKFLLVVLAHGKDSFCACMGQCTCIRISICHSNTKP